MQLNTMYCAVFLDQRHAEHRHRPVSVTVTVTATAKVTIISFCQE